jgi:CDP-glucose 4,6-dehydratase
MLRARLRGARPVLRSTGRASRDWLWVGDAVAAYLGAAERLAEGEDAVAAPLRGQAFNVSTGRPRTVLEVARAVDDALGVHEPSHEILGRAEDEGEIPAQTLDCRRAREVLGWEATVGLEEGLRRTLPWYRDYFAEAG